MKARAQRRRGCYRMRMTDRNSDGSEAIEDDLLNCQKSRG